MAEESLRESDKPDAAAGRDEGEAPVDHRNEAAYSPLQSVRRQQWSTGDGQHTKDEAQDETHICVRMHHFREHIRKGAISIHKIQSRYQLADIATKPQPVVLFKEQRELLLQWQAETATAEEFQQKRRPI
jgi:hypothetical protein